MIARDLELELELELELVSPVLSTEMYLVNIDSSQLNSSLLGSWLVTFCVQFTCSPHA